MPFPMGKVIPSCEQPVDNSKMVRDRAFELAKKIATESGTVTGARVLRAMRDESFPGLDEIDPRFMGQVFKGKEFEKSGYSVEEGSHGRPVTVWKLR